MYVWENRRVPTLPQTSSTAPIIIKNIGFSLEFSPSLKSPLWVLEKISKERIPSKVTSRKGCKFKRDPRIDIKYQPDPKDFCGSGFTRGHMAKAAHHTYDRQALEETFYFPNITPQFQSFNSGIWARVENIIDAKLIEFDHAEILSGPLFKTAKKTNSVALARIQRFGKSGVAIPTGFYKVMFGKKFTGEYALYSFLIPHIYVPPTVPLSYFQVPLSRIEESAGIKVLGKLNLSIAEIDSLREKITPL